MVWYLHVNPGTALDIDTRAASASIIKLTSHNLDATSFDRDDESTPRATATWCAALLVLALMLICAAAGAVLTTTSLRCGVAQARTGTTATRPGGTTQNYTTSQNRDRLVEG
jgi:hypothetical protein